MRPNKSVEKSVSDRSTDIETLQECDICGVTLWCSFARFACVQPDPKHKGNGDLWQDTSDVCLDCREAGVASFPDRRPTPETCATAGTKGS
jgi:catabolite regulation protein CreA